MFDKFESFEKFEEFEQFEKFEKFDKFEKFEKFKSWKVRQNTKHLNHVWKAAKHPNHDMLQYPRKKSAFRASSAFLAPASTWISDMCVVGYLIWIKCVGCFFQICSFLYQKLCFLPLSLLHAPFVNRVSYCVVSSIKYFISYYVVCKNILSGTWNHFTIH